MDKLLQNIKNIKNLRSYHQKIQLVRISNILTGIGRISQVKLSPYTVLNKLEILLMHVKYQKPDKSK